MTNDEIGAMSKWQWKKLVQQKTNLSAFTFLNEDNKTKEKTNHIHLKKTRNWFIFKRIFKDRSFKKKISDSIQNLKYQRISPMEI